MYDILIKLQTGKLRRLPPGSKWVGTPSPGPPFLRSGLKERFFLWKRTLSGRKDSFIPGNAIVNMNLVETAFLEVDRHNIPPPHAI